MFNIDYKKLVKMLLPIPLRMHRVIALITWLTEPLRYVYGKLTAYISYANNELAHGSQIVYLEKYLNDRFDPDYRRFVVIDGTEADTPYMSTYDENDSMVFSTYTEDNSGIMSTYDEVQPDYFNFIVEYDNTLGNLNPDQNELKACIDLRRLPGMRYSINVIIN